MTIVFVHGVPETPSLWDPIREFIPEPGTALRLPGFGVERPEDVRDKEGYAAWLAAELRAIGGPIDLVGHDWGGHLTLRVVTAYDVPVRSWVTDIAYSWHPGYRWHEIAELWQKSPEGEEMLAGLRNAPTGSGFSLGDALQPRGMSAELGREVDEIHDEEMDAAILSLYRSAWPNPYADWGEASESPTTAAGLVLAPSGDPMANLKHDRAVAERLGARFHELPNLTHFWMLQDPEGCARVLRDFWAAVS
ncbi:Pimeloyl-ACP methyl ester carboxylesterase [Lentzea fradiae]|uniref:Pimeloyl-ACP methyl ester carboxylesterase n=1 Tax=Lentzea fradiae TaxID=200378 RepID=A0A1G7Y9S6_9PSEU|nr:alpha/beta hydrolase [Lentzea fradiae]SDG93083.1 Pimeloyl-ACP methyl ester carboxylesterase [Lentzea fradiae]